MYSVGHGDSGQLGLGPHVKATAVPTCLPLQYDEFNYTLIVAGIAHNGKQVTVRSNILSSLFSSSTNRVWESIYVWTRLSGTARTRWN